MLSITVLGEEYFDDDTQTFFTKDDYTLELEHSLVSLSKWESMFEKPFLAEGNKSTEETLAYIKCMVLNEKNPPEVFSNLSEANYEEVNNYIVAPMTATWFSDSKIPSRNTEAITSELIYYWLVSFNIPFECQYWHLNRLFTLIKVFNVKNTKPKKMSRSEMAERNRALNEQRKKQYGTQG